MNIEVGEYVRTKKGNIGKVLDITTCTGQKRKKYLIKWNIVKAYYITGTTIIKHSPNIIGLIEVGDYVNGVEVIDLADGIHLEFANNVPFVDVGLASYTDGHVEGIETIVTKQQFNNMEYRV